MNESLSSSFAVGQTWLNAIGYEVRITEVLVYHGQTFISYQYVENLAGAFFQRNASVTTKWVRVS